MAITGRPRQSVMRFASTVPAPKVSPASVKAGAGSIEAARTRASHRSCN